LVLGWMAIFALLSLNPVFGFYGFNWLKGFYVIVFCSLVHWLIAPLGVAKRGSCFSSAMSSFLRCDYSLEEHEGYTLRALNNIVMPD